MLWFYHVQSLWLLFLEGVEFLFLVCLELKGKTAPFVACHSLSDESIISEMMADYGILLYIMVSSVEASVASLSANSLPAIPLWAFMQVKCCCSSLMVLCMLSISELYFLLYFNKDKVILLSVYTATTFPS